MSALLASVAGDIPGLLMRGSPVRRTRTVSYAHEGSDGVVTRINGGNDVFVCWASDSTARERPTHLALDLTDATGRAQAAAWLTHQQSGALVRRLDRADYDVYLLARDFSDMTPNQIDSLARLVYRAAGRLP